MSWSSYIDNMLAQSNGNLTKGCIIGFDGSMWTTGGNEVLMQVTAEEAAVVGRVMQSKSSLAVQKEFVVNGIVLENQKYMFIRDFNNDGQCVVGKKAGHGAVTLQSTNKAVVIGFTPEGKEPRGSTNAVNIIADYLTKSNY